MESQGERKRQGLSQHGAWASPEVGKLTNEAADKIKAIAVNENDDIDKKMKKIDTIETQNKVLCFWEDKTKQ